MYCKKCNYCLAHLGDAVVCPECGERFDKGDAKTYYVKNPEVVQRLARMNFYAIFILVIFQFQLDVLLFLDDDFSFKIGLERILLTGYLLTFGLGIGSMIRDRVKWSEFNEERFIGLFFAGGFATIGYWVYHFFV